MDNTTQNSDEPQGDFGPGNGRTDGSTGADVNPSSLSSAWTQELKSASGLVDDAQLEDKSAESEAEPEKRRGFHPALVLSTIAVVLFVLWFCPWALMRSRQAQNEQSAIAVMREITGKLLPMMQVKTFNNSLRINDAQLRMVSREYQPEARKLMIGGIPTPVAWLTPRYYGSTALRTICRFNSTIYAKDLGKLTALSELRLPDDTWKKIGPAKQ